MRAPPGQMTRPKLPALLGDGTLAGEWGPDPRRASVRLKAKTMGLIAVNGGFRELSGHRTVSADGEVSSTLMLAADSIDTGNIQRDMQLCWADLFDSRNHPHITFHRDQQRDHPRGVRTAASACEHWHSAAHTLL